MAIIYHIQIPKLHFRLVLVMDRTKPIILTLKMIMAFIIMPDELLHYNVIKDNIYLITTETH